MSGLETGSRLWLLWAKRPYNKPTATEYHPVLCHLLDVAMVTQALWDSVLPATTRDWVAAALGLDAGAARAWIGLWAGLHDVGKASPAFQQQDAQARLRLEAAGFYFPDLGARGAA